MVCYMYISTLILIHNYVEYYNMYTNCVIILCFIRSIFEYINYFNFGVFMIFNYTFVIRHTQQHEMGYKVLYHCLLCEVTNAAKSIFNEVKEFINYNYISILYSLELIKYWDHLLLFVLFILYGW